MKVKLIALCLSMLTLGCIPSLHPIYKDSDLVERPAIVGKWTCEKDRWEFQRAGDKRYDVTYTDEHGKPGRFDGRLAKLGETLFLDLYPKSPDDINANDYYKAHLVPAHTFLRIDVAESAVKLAAMNPDWFKKYVAEHPDAIAHEKSDDGIVITAKTDAIQKFLLAHLKTPDAWGETFELKRAQP